MYSVVLYPAVKTDLISAVEFYKQVNPHLARKFLHRFREAKDHILRSPKGFQIRYKNVRAFLMKQFPYQVHYLIDEKKQVIVILAVIHAYRNPADYTKR